MVIDDELYSYADLALLWFPSYFIGSYLNVFLICPGASNRSWYDSISAMKVVYSSTSYINVIPGNRNVILKGGNIFNGKENGASLKKIWLTYILNKDVDN